MSINYSKPSPEPKPASSGPSGGGVNLSKVTLTKSSPTISLTKSGGGSGVLRVNLNWKTTAPSSGRGGLFGFGKSAAAAIDLDLGCLYEFSDGSKGVVQALGNAFTSQQTFRTEPVIWLDGDDRSGQNTDGENLFVDLGAGKNIKRIIVFAFIYEGTPNWASAEAVATLHPVSGAPIEILLDEADTSSPLCAIALIDNARGELDVRREVRYIKGAQSALDDAYGWGMNWSRGRK